MSPHPNLNEPQNIPKKRSLGFIIILLAILATIAIAGFQIFVKLPVSTTASRFCGTACHSMNPSYQSWRRSDHAKTPCLDCHSDGSKTNRFIKFIELGTKHIPQEVLEKYEPIKVAQNEIISEKTCVRCHKPKKRSESKGRIMDHKTHADIDLNCKTCHNRVSHEDAPRYTPLSKEGRPEPYFADYMTMRKGCWRCHKKGGIFIAANGKEIPGPYTIGKAVALTDCGICHAPATFSHCHVVS
ncbi:MAG TPA: hypothetical protein ENI11_03100, partial [Actinobacteria bacterium]|nr:hypothetical protein [Actinomycetota bacterium]